jgi:AraC-like DNA-binding protein
MNLDIHVGNNQLESFNRQVEQVLAGAGSLSIGQLKIHVQSFHFNIQPANCNVPEHEHPYYEIAFMRRGAMTNFTEFGNVQCTPDNDTLFFVPPTTVHRRLFSSAPNNVNTSFILTISANTWNGELYCRRLPELVTKHGCQFALTTELAHILKMLDQQMFESPNSAPPVIATLINVFLLLFFQKYFPELFHLELPEGFLREHDFNRNRILSIKAFVERSLNGNVPLSKCETVFGMSMRHLNRIFQASTGQTIRQYLVRRQLETAEMLLLNSTCSIAEVAQAIHFKSPALFSRFFHHHRGISPTEFRQLNLLHIHK